MAIKSSKRAASQSSPGAVRGYSGSSLKMVSFPLGGIGTGTIGLGGRGQLTDWEIFNNPALWSVLPYTMPFLFARSGERKMAVVLERQVLPPYHKPHGLPPAEMAGLPRVKEAVFAGTYPMARMWFQDDRLPVEVSLTAFNPMIPFDPEDSGIPVAVLTYTLRNPGRQKAEGTLAISLSNQLSKYIPDDKKILNINTFRRESGLRGLYMVGRGAKKDQLGFGTMALTTTSRGATAVTDFKEAGWFDLGQKLWDRFSTDGRLNGTNKPSGARTRFGTVGMLGVPFELAPGKQVDITFMITWSFPNHKAPSFGIKSGNEKMAVRNHYARRFPDAWRAAAYTAKNLPRLRERTERFERTLFASTLPAEVLDAVSSQMAIIRTNTTMWLDSPVSERLGRVFGYEGCNADSGCCPLNCTHVWNYEQSLAHLYPALERTMRLTDYEDNIHHNGGMTFRTTLPLGQGLKLWRTELPAADGQFGTVVKVHREWRLSGDDRFLRRIWPNVKKSIRFAWKGFALWDADQDGVMEGVQHNTYDIEFHGPNSMCGSLYLAALKAGVEMAEAMGDRRAAEEFAAVYESGRKKLDKMLYNGRFYTQKVRNVDTKGKPLADRPKYQYGYGCLSDQLLGQWAAHVAGLGYVLPPEHVRSAMDAVFTHNFKPDLAEHGCCQRVYALNGEGGLLICTWPEGRRETFPFPYSDEVWTGIEYQVAAHLIYEGRVREGLAIVQAVRARHDGISRNPWNEYECGDHYARAMASWSVLLALSGQRYDGRTAALTVRPVYRKNDFACLVTAAEGYGLYRQRFEGAGLSASLECSDGRVRLAMLDLSAPKGVAKVSCRLNGRVVRAEVVPADGGVRVGLARPVTLTEGDRLEIQLK